MYITVLESYYKNKGSKTLVVTNRFTLPPLLHRPDPSPSPKEKIHAEQQADKFILILVDHLIG